MRDLALAKLKTVEKQKADVERVRDELRCAPQSCAHRHDLMHAALQCMHLVQRFSMTSSCWCMWVCLKIKSRCCEGNCHAAGA